MRWLGLLWRIFYTVILGVFRGVSEAGQPLRLGKSKCRCLGSCETPPPQPGMSQRQNESSPRLSAETQNGAHTVARQEAEQKQSGQFACDSVECKRGELAVEGAFAGVRSSTLPLS